MAETSGARVELEDLIDVSEKGGVRGGEPQRLDRRLFMQLVAFGGCDDEGALVQGLESAGFTGVLYRDLNDHRGVGLLAFDEDPDFFVTRLRGFLVDGPFAALQPKPDLTMFGRTYALGYEPDLEDALIARPRRNVTNPAWPWAIWYPLRRSGEFARLPAADQRRILKEHGSIGIAFGQADLGHDVRLACFGLDRNDNDFVIGLVGPALHPLSKIVETMRSTEQTSRYIESLGPFFVGKAVWQASGRA